MARKRRGPKGPNRALTEGEVALVKASFSGRYAARDRCLFILGIRTGYRIRELLSLRVADVYQYGQVVERVTVERRNMKGSRRSRTVPLHPEAREAIATWLAEIGTADRARPLFASRQRPRKPICYGQARRILREIYEANGLEGNLATHAMRKTFAANIHRALGNDLFKTQRALGHASIQSTIHYLQADLEEIDEAIVGLA